MEVELNLLFTNFLNQKFGLPVRIFSTELQISTEIIYNSEIMFYVRGIACVQSFFDL